MTTIAPQREQTNPFRALVREMDDGRDSVSLADALMDRLLAMRKASLREHLFPIVLNAVIDLRRNDVREAERRAVAPPPDVDVCEPASEVKRLLDAAFFSPAREGLVLWADATAEDHRSRAAYLRKMAEGTLRTAKTHERAAEIIQAHGVGCLADLGEGFDPKDLEP